MPILRYAQSIGARGWAVPLDEMSLEHIGLGSNICMTHDPMITCPLLEPRVFFLSWIIPNDKDVITRVEGGHLHPVGDNYS